jgi:UDP-N-acetylglucosamine 1-carboxyvinyltransferase
MFDRLELITFIAAAAVTNSELFIENGRISSIKPEAIALGQMGISLFQDSTGVLVRSPRKLHSVNLEFQVSPKAHSDAQPFFTVLACFADNPSLIVDLLYDRRFIYANELIKMGGKLTISDTGMKLANGLYAQRAMISPVESLVGTRIIATDIRGGAALLIASLVAQGRTTITNISQIDRGYENIDSKLARLGAKIERLSSS